MDLLPTYQLEQFNHGKLAPRILIVPLRQIDAVQLINLDQIVSKYVEEYMPQKFHQIRIMAAGDSNALMLNK